MRMKQTFDSRRAEIFLNYNGFDLTIDLDDELIDFTYNDAAPGSLDDLQITLQDRERKWQSPEWIPMQGDRIKAEIRTFNWEKDGEKKKLPLGHFEVDTFEYSGPPDTVSIKAVSLPVSSSIRQEKRTKAWEKVTLKSIAAEVAKKSGLKLVYSAPDNPSYDRLDQMEQSDLGFLNDTAIAEGIGVKVVSKQLVLFDEFEYEKKKPVATLTIGKDNVLSYQFSWSSSDASYVACEVSYTKPKDKKTYKAIYKPPKAPKLGPTLKVKEQVDSEAAALRKAMMSLREKNKESGKASFSLVGDIRLAAGVTVQIEGAGWFDGRYLIESASHKIGSGGYTTDVEVRMVMGW